MYGHGVKSELRTSPLAEKVWVGISFAAQLISAILVNSCSLLQLK